MIRFVNENVYYKNLFVLFYVGMLKKQIARHKFWMSNWYVCKTISVMQTDKFLNGTIRIENYDNDPVLIFAFFIINRKFIQISNIVFAIFFFASNIIIYNTLTMILRHLFI